MIIFHGTGGHPRESWFPWIKKELEKLGCKVSIPQFPEADHPTPHRWYPIMKHQVFTFDKNTILVGHSLGGAIALRALEKSPVKITAAFIVAAPVGVLPIKFIEGDKPFIKKPFNWEKIRKSAKSFTVFHSDNDQFISKGNGDKIAENLGIPLTFVPGAGHFNSTAGYNKFKQLLDMIKDKL